MEGPPDLVFPGETRSLRLLVGVYGDDGTPRAAWTIGTVSAGKERFGSATLTELAADRNRIAFAGMVFGVVELGTGARRRVLTTVGATDIYFGALENDGALGWAIRGGGTGSDTPGPIALGRDGSVSISGRTSNDGQGPAFGTPDPVTFGEASAPALHRTGGLDALVGQIDRRGHLVWASTVGGDEPWGLKAHSKYGAVVPSFEESIAGTLALPNGETLFIGNAALPTLFQGKTILLAHPGASAGSFVGRVSAAGRLLAAATLGLEHVDAVAAAPGGDLIVAGEIEGVATYPATGLKQTTMTSAGREDVFVARQAPDGTLRWGIRLGGRGHDRAERVTIDAGGAVTIAARFDEGFAIGDQVCGAPPPHEFPAGTVDLIRFAPGGPHPDDARESRLAAERAKISALQGEASRAFKDKRYAQACAAYQNVAASRPDSGAALADVGLCLQRRGKKKEAIAADQKAVALAAKTDLSDDGDPSTRKHAYFNLYKLGVRVALPKTGCRKLPAAPGCRRSLWACVGKEHSEGSGGETNSTYARIGVSKAAAQIDEGDDARPSTESSIPDDQRDSADVTLEEEVVSFCHEGDAPTCGEQDGTMPCEIVSADACLGLVSVVCPGAATRTGRAGTEVNEIRVRPSQ